MLQTVTITNITIYHPIFRVVSNSNVEEGIKKLRIVAPLPHIMCCFKLRLRKDDCKDLFCTVVSLRRIIIDFEGHQWYYHTMILLYR